MALQGGRALELPSPTYPTAQSIGMCLRGVIGGEMLRPITCVCRKPRPFDLVTDGVAFAI